MRRHIMFWIVLIVCTGFLYSCRTPKRTSQPEKTFGEIALEQSRTPIRPGQPGKAPFWNGYAKRFIYAPAFDFETITNAEKYRYEIVSLKDSSTYHFESDVPYAPLSPVWEDVPVSLFNIQVIGLSTQGDSLGLAGKGQYYRASPYKPTSDGTYHKPVMPYDSSAMIALDKLMHKDYVDYWLSHKSPDPNYILYRYSNKIMSALVIGAVTHARLTTNKDEVKRSTKIATIVADYLLDISDSKGSPLEYFPRSYHGYEAVFNKKPSSHMQHNHTMVPYAADAGTAYLDLYDLTGTEKYLEAAKRIARTFLKRQLDNGTWYLLVNNESGKPVVQIMTIPTRIINYFNRLTKDYHMKGLKEPTQKALDWVMDNPIKTFDWHAQFEDVKPTPPYKNHSREQACDMAIYLFKNNKNIALAEDLVRFAEDQFVIWENPMSVKIRNTPGYYSKNWLTPSVQEQYYWWMPVARSAGIMIDTYWYAYKATNKEIYLAKAKSIANSFTLAQKVYDGNYPTYFTKSKYPLNVWLNNVIWPAKVMMKLQNNLADL